MIQKITNWFLPPVLTTLGRKIRFVFMNTRKRDICQGNSRFRGIYEGKRCFIVCNGPSINSQNLLPLNDDIVFSVSSGYHHRDYLQISPLYHCVPSITYTEKFTQDDAINWFWEMHENIGNAELFLSSQEEPLVRNNNLFPGRIVHYVYMYGQFNDYRDSIFDISRAIPGVQSVPIMCLLIAIYMGFKNIYLIGVEHDSFIKGEYKYFFDQTILAGKSGGVTGDDKVTSLYDELQAAVILWQQYRAIKKVAALIGCKIYNATNGGALDEFERVTLENVFNT